MFGSRVGLSGSADRMVLFPVTSNPSCGSWIISNGHISATAHSAHLYSAHCAVIFAIARAFLLQNRVLGVYCFVPYMREPKGHREPPQKARLRHMS